MVGPELNTRKIKYMVMSCHQNAGQSCNLLFANKSFEYVTKIKIFGSD